MTGRNGCALPLHGCTWPATRRTVADQPDTKQVRVPRALPTDRRPGERPQSRRRAHIMASAVSDMSPALAILKPPQERHAAAGIAERYITEAETMIHQQPSAHLAIPRGRTPKGGVANKGGGQGLRAHGAAPWGRAHGLVIKPPDLHHSASAAGTRRAASVQGNMSMPDDLDTPTLLRRLATAHGIPCDAALPPAPR